MNHLIAFWNNRRTRGYIYQVILGLLFALLLVFISINTSRNLDDLGKSFGMNPLCIFKDLGFNVYEGQDGADISWVCSDAGLSIPDDQSLGIYDVNQEGKREYWRIYVIGLLNTLRLAAVGIVLATALGFVVGILSLSQNLLVRGIARTYTEVFRNTPLIIQILFWYFGVFFIAPGLREFGLSAGDSAAVLLTNRGLYLPALQFGAVSGWGLLIGLLLAILAILLLSRSARRRLERSGKTTPVLWISLGLLIALPGLGFLLGGAELTVLLPTMENRFRLDAATTTYFHEAYAALLIALVMYTGAFIGEIVRAGILAVPKGQSEAARSLGLRQNIITRLVIVPQALRVVIPPLTSQYLNLTKNTTLAAAISYWELQAGWGGTVLNQTSREIEIVLSVMVTFLLISLFTSLMMNIYNRRTALKER